GLSRRPAERAPGGGAAAPQRRGATTPAATGVGSHPLAVPPAGGAGGGARRAGGGGGGPPPRASTVGCGEAAKRAASRIPRRGGWGHEVSNVVSSVSLRDRDDIGPAADGLCCVRCQRPARYIQIKATCAFLPAPAGC